MQLTPDDIRKIREVHAWMRTNAQRATIEPVYTRKPPRMLPSSKDDTISVYNATGSTIPQYGVLELDGSVQNESEISQPPESKTIIYNGVTPSALGSGVDLGVWNKRVVVAQVEIGAGKVGKCKISGITPVKVFSDKNPNPYQAHVATTSTTTRLEARHHNSGYGFPILYRERGTGEKWAVVDLEHHDAPGFYHIIQPASGTITESVTTTATGSAGVPWVWTANPSDNNYFWRWSGNAQRTRHNTAVPFQDQVGGLRLQGESTWIGFFAGTAIIRQAVSWYNGKPHLQYGNTFPYRGKIEITMAGDGVSACSALWCPSYRSIEHPAESLSGFGTGAGAVVDYWNFYVPFIIDNSHVLASAVTEPLRIRVLSAGWRASFLSQSNTTPPTPSPLRTIEWDANHVAMWEVNPANNLFLNAVINGASLSGGVVQRGGSYSSPSSKGGSPTSQSLQSYPVSAIVKARPSQTLKAKFVGGTGTAPI